MQDDQEIDRKKRRLLQLAGALGAIGAVGGAVPFASSLYPSRSALLKGKPVKVDLSSMKTGEQKTVMWRGKPIWIIKRNEDMLAKLSANDNQLRDPASRVPQQPNYAQNAYRSINPEYLVLIGVCTHLGCAPTYRPEKGVVDESWPGGFFCSCHGSKFDLAGRVFDGVPAPTNLEIPPHHFRSKDVLIIGSE